MGVPRNEFAERTTRSQGRQSRPLRLPGSVAEIEASPEGPEVGAFFDLDGTLVAGFTGVLMTQDRLRRGQMSVGEFIGMVQAGLNHQLGRSEFEDLIGKGARMLHGNSLSDLDELGERLFVQHDPEAHLPRDARHWCARTWPAGTPSC